MPAPLRRVDLVMLAACAGIGLLLRIWLLRHDTVITPDGVYYVKLGLAFSGGRLAEGMSSYWPPLYPLLVGLSHRIIGDGETAARAVSIVSGALLVPVSFMLVRDGYGRRAGLIAALLVAVNPCLISSSTKALADAVYTLLLLLGLFLALRAIPAPAAATGLGAGLLLSAAFLARPEGLGFVALFVLLASAVVLRSGMRSTRHRRYLAAVSLGAFVLSAPYLLYVRLDTGGWTVSQKFAAHFAVPKVDWYRLTPDGETTVADVFYAGQGWGRAGRIEPEPMATAGEPLRGSMLENLWHKLFGGLRKQYYEILPGLLPNALLLTTFLGLFGTPWSGTRIRRDLLLVGFVALHFIGYAVTWSEIRYFYPVLPIFLGWAALGVERMEHWAVGSLPDRIGRRQGPRLALRAALVAGLVLVQVPAITRPIRESRALQALEVREVGEWLGSRLARGSVILANSPVIGFYAGAAHHYVPDEDLATIAGHARRKRARYVVILEQKVRRNELSSQWALLDPEFEHPGLRRVHVNDRRSQHKIVVYEVVGWNDESDS